MGLRNTEESMNTAESTPEWFAAVRTFLVVAAMSEIMPPSRSKRSRWSSERALSHIVSSIDAGNVVMFGPAFYVACSLFKDEKPPQLARGTCLVRSVFVTPGRLIFRPPQLGHAWCSASRDKAREKALFQWLVPSPLEAFQLASHPFDRDVKLSSISFGTLVQLGVFVQHKLSSSSIIDDHSDYWINATFHHDQHVLHVDLHLNHREACAGLIAEYRFIVPYLDITKVMINDRNRHVEIYLHLKTPAMVMGQVIMDNLSRPGSAAAATPLRWERHLAIGCDCIGDTVRMASLCGGLFLKLVLTDHSLARRMIGRLSQRCTQGTLFCYAPVRTYCPDVVVGRWTVEVLVHFENRILSEFNAEFAIRVSFRDDNLDKLSFSLNLHSSRDAILNAVVARFLHDGLQVGTREFKFLAPSTCQLRDHGRELLKPTYVVTAIASDSTTRQSAKVSPLSTCKKKPVSFSGTIGAKLSLEFDAYKNSKLAFPIGVTATASGNIIIADTSQDRVMVFDPNGRGLHKATFSSGAMVSMEIEINIANRTTDTAAVLTLTKTQLAFRGQLPAATSGCQHQVTDVRDGLCVVGLAVY
ncbi:hypothetical protein MRX96_025501 [Rhipicephalus microplus]